MTTPPVRVEDGKIYIGRMLVATYTGDVTADSASVIQQAKARTVQEQIRDNINARLRDRQRIDPAEPPPARVRRLHAPLATQTYGAAAQGAVSVAYTMARVSQRVMDGALRALAAVYKDHPDYQEGWA